MLNKVKAELSEGVWGTVKKVGKLIGKNPATKFALGGVTLPAMVANDMVFPNEVGAGSSTGSSPREKTKSNWNIFKANQKQRGK